MKGSVRAMVRGRSFVVALLVVGLTLAPAGPAVADTATFGQPANVGGTVTDTSGAGISGVPLILERRATFEAEWQFQAQTTTGVDGTWVIPVAFLSPSPSGYRVTVLTTDVFVPVSSRLAGEENFYITDNDQPIDFTLTRFGRASGAITNAGEGLSGLIELRVWDGSSWTTPSGGGIGILTSASTTYGVSGLQVGERYAVRFTMNDGSRYATTWSNSSTSPPAGPMEPGTFEITEVGQVISGPDVTLERLVAISGTVLGGGSALSGAFVAAEEIGGAGTFQQTTTASDGSYTLFVPGNATYRLYAYTSGYRTQFFDGIDVCCDATPVDLIDADRSGVDFSLRAENDVIVVSLELFTTDDNAAEEPSLGDRAVLYRAVGDVWEQVAAVDAADDSSVIEFLRTVPGEYKVRFQDGQTSAWVPVLDVSGAILADAGCSVSVGALALGALASVEVVLDRRAGAPTCTAEPAPTPPDTDPPSSTPPGSVPRTPVVPAPATPEALLVAPAPAVASEDQPDNAGPTEESDGPVSPPAPTDDSPSSGASQGGADLSWLAWVLGGGAIAALVVTGIAVTRRRA